MEEVVVHWQEAAKVTQHSTTGTFVNGRKCAILTSRNLYPCKLCVSSHKVWYFESAVNTPKLNGTIDTAKMVNLFDQAPHSVEGNQQLYAPCFHV